jgi:hypothetical protein
VSPEDTALSLAVVVKLATKIVNHVGQDQVTINGDDGTVNDVYLVNMQLIMRKKNVLHAQVDRQIHFIRWCRLKFVFRAQRGIEQDMINAFHAHLGHLQLRKDPKPATRAALGGIKMRTHPPHASNVQQAVFPTHLNLNYAMNAQLIRILNFQVQVHAHHATLVIGLTTK